MLKNKQNPNSNSSSHHTNQNSASTTDQKRHQGGDTGGQPQVEQSRKKNDMVISIPRDITSPSMLQHIMDENENLMPDIIKEIRKTPDHKI